MKILMRWLRILLRSKKQSVGRKEDSGTSGSSSFETWIGAYRQRLDDGRGERSGS